MRGKRNPSGRPHDPWTQFMILVYLIAGADFFWELMIDGKIDLSLIALFLYEPVKGFLTTRGFRNICKSQPRSQNTEDDLWH